MGFNIFSTGDMVRIKDAYRDDYSCRLDMLDRDLKVASSGGFGSFLYFPDEDNTVLISNHMLEKVTKPKPFKTGDVVRVKDDVTGYSTIRGNDMEVKAVWQNTVGIDHGHMRFNVPFEALELSNKRIEGEEIRAENVKEGDEILVTISGDDLTITKQGIVSTVSHHTEYGQDNTVIRVGKPHAQHRIFSSKDDNTTITLIKAAPAVDPIKVKLEKLKTGNIVHIGSGEGGNLAYKNQDGTYTLYPSVKTLKEDELVKVLHEKGYRFFAEVTV